MDTHVHTCLSPCADLDMHPAALAQAAVEAGVYGIVISGHNAAGNIAAVRRAGRRSGLEVLAGMEVTTAEEVHVAAVLPDVEAALTLQSRVHRDLPGRNDQDAFGLQVLVNEDAEVLGFEQHFLSGATTWSLSRTVEEVHRVGGLAVAAHADREGFGVIGQLGSIPPDLPLDAVEVSVNGDLWALRASLPRPVPILRGSDAHRLDEVGRAVTFLWAEEASFEELSRAVLNRGGRFVLGGGRPMDEISMHVLDIAQNAVEAGARRIEIVEDPEADLLVVEVRDDGRGMDPETLKRVTDPFVTTRTTRRVGMGLSLLKAATEAAGGSLDVASEPGKGTCMRAVFQLGHVDRAPLGDIETTVLVLMVGSPGIAVRFRHARGTRSWELDSEDLARTLDGASFSSPEGIAWLRATIRRGEASLSGAGDPRGSGPRARG